MTPTLRLADCGDTLSIEELCGVLGISQRKYFHLKAHGITLVESLPHLPYRFGKSAVQAFIDSNGLGRLRRVS